MPRTSITVVSADNTSLTPTTGDATNDHQFSWSPTRMLMVRNAHTGAQTVAIPTPGTVGRAGLAIADGSWSVPNGSVPVKIDTRDPIYRQADGMVHVDLTDATGLTFGVLDVTP